jgi:hypothetical protein
MKKFIVSISILMVLLSVLVACEDKEESVDSSTTTTSSTISTIDPNYSMTQPQYTVGAAQTSERFGTDNKAYVVVHYDENGNVAREDVYENGRMAYYYIVTGTTEEGNAIQVKYYKPDGRFVAYFDNTFFFDENGNKISETEFESILRA